MQHTEDHQPEYLQTAVFNRLFAEAEIAKFTRAELMEYEDSLKAYKIYLQILSFQIYFISLQLV